MKLVSIIMPVKNGEKYLKEAVQSILNQTYKNFEFIIVNDHSQDKTLPILKNIIDKRIKIYTNKTALGLTRSLNKALRHARGEFIARMDADDIAAKDRLAIQVNYLLKNKAVGVVGSAFRIIDNNKNISIVKFPRKHAQIIRQLFLRNPLRHPTVMYYKYLVDKYGPYDPSLDGAEDYDLWLRFAQYTRLANIAKPLLTYRIHDSQVSEKEEKKVLKSAILARIKALRKYKYSFYNLIYLPLPLLTYLLPPYISKKIRSLILKFIYLWERLYIHAGKLVIICIQKTTIFTSLGMHLVKITGKYHEVVHPKHLVNIRDTWFIKYLTKKDVVLDIGCNNGQNTMKAAKIANRVIGFDSDAKNLKVARRDILKNNFKNIKLLNHNAEEALPFNNKSFNVVMFFAVLEHLKNRVQAVSEVYRVLKPGGKLLLSVPNKGTTWKKIQNKFSLSYFADSDHKIEFTKGSITGLINKHNLKVISIEPVSFDMPFIGLIDFIGGLSLTAYKLLNQLRRRLVLKYPQETVSFEVVAVKQKP